jgi:SAM-dependent methyltransferase
MALVITSAEAASPPCLYCRSESFQPLYDDVRDRLGYVPGVWSFVRCNGCGSAHLRPFPNARDVPSFYPPVYTFSPDLARTFLKRALSTLEYQLFFRPLYRAQARLVDRYTRRRTDAPGKLLDIGCGMGLRLLEFRKLGYEVHGMDFDEASVDYLRKTLGIPAVATDIGGLTDRYPRGSFDAITAFYVLEHMVDVEHALRQCLALLKPGGWFAGAVPLIDSLQAKLLRGRNVNVREAPRHISIPTQHALRQLACSTGYSAESLRLLPERISSCSASASLSLVPDCSTTNVYGSRRIFGLTARVIGALGVLALLPLVAVENLVVRKPVMGIFLAQKPLS